MEISDKLAIEIFSICAFHIFAILLVTGFTFYLYLKSKKTPLIYSYLAVVGMLLIWMFAKIFKSVSPNETLRWIFIVIQYFGIDYLGFFLLLFALLYSKGALPKPLTLGLLNLLPTLCFLTILTNPLHHHFYSYYDFYKDSFGVLFFASQIIQYIYLFSSIVILGKGFTHQAIFGGNKYLGRAFAAIVLLPILGNIYYMLIKLTDVPWIFSFPFFDFTPITSSIALILFMLPAIKYRFLDITHLAYSSVFQTLPSGIAFFSPQEHLYGFNTTFIQQFPHTLTGTRVVDFCNSLPILDEDLKTQLYCFLTSKTSEKQFMTIVLEDFTAYNVFINRTKEKYVCVFFTDVSAPIQLAKQLEKKHIELKETNLRIVALAEGARELALTRTQTKIAQDIHDILGHSLTVVIGTADLACRSTSTFEAEEKLRQIEELLLNSLTDLKNSLHGKSLDLGYTSLIRAITSLSNDTLCLDFTLQGTPYELSTKITESIYRICQEAMTNAIKHGMAKTLHCILRYRKHEIELYLIDDGKGCKLIKKNLGLTGMVDRVNELKGHITFGSNTEHETSTGFHIHVQIPITFLHEQNQQTMPISTR